MSTNRRNGTGTSSVGLFAIGPNKVGNKKKLEYVVNIMGNVRVEWEDAEAVVRLWRQEAGTQRGVSVEDLSETLGVSQDEVLRLLAEVRSQRTQARPVRRFTDGAGVWSFGIAAALVGVIGFGFGEIRAKQSPQPVVVRHLDGNYEVTVPGALPPAVAQVPDPELPGQLLGEDGRPIIIKDADVATFPTERSSNQG